MAPQYSLEYGEEWDKYYAQLDKGMQDRVWKKIQQLKGELPARHLRKGLDFFVCGIGQYRIVYKISVKEKVKRICFIGDHKEYEKWLGI